MLILNGFGLAKPLHWVHAKMMNCRFTPPLRHYTFLAICPRSGLVRNCPSSLLLVHACSFAAQRLFGLKAVLES